MAHEVMEYDVVIVGAGPAGLSAAIQLRNMAPALKICIIEKGSEVGSHILSGAVIELRALNELLPDWQDHPFLNTPVMHDAFLYLTKNHALPLPTPPPLRNTGNTIVSLGKLCQWLARQAQQMGIEIYCGFAGKEVIYATDGSVRGILVGDFGLNKQGEPTAQFQAGIALHAKQTLFAEGCRGSLTRSLIERLQLNQNCTPQTYGIGVKELWEIDPTQHQAGTVIHTVGWPLDQKTYGGSFIYHFENNLLAIGLVVGLDYQNPYLDPFAEMQRFKTHPKIKPLLLGGRRISYGARALSEGGLQSLPKLSFPGGLLIGDSAGFLNVPKIKGTHLAMKSGMIAAETIANALNSTGISGELIQYQNNLKKSWAWDELHRVRNIRPGFRLGLWLGLSYAAIDTYLLRGRAPWTFKNHADHTQLKQAKSVRPIVYPKPDGQVTFDKLSSVQLSNTFHREGQPCHLQLTDPKLAISVNWQQYGAPEQYYCPANVYEIIQQESEVKLQINASNCIHCKTCDIKDPLQNIRWVPPEGGGGPNYSNM